MKTRNSEKLASFVAYCDANPDERFWQALRNWSDVYQVLLRREMGDEATEETFNVE